MARINFRKNATATVSVPSIFIDKHMPKANGSFVKVYLYGLMYSSMPGVSATNKDIAQALDMLESDVYNAWKYWEREGIINISRISTDEVDIEFLELAKVEEPKVEKPQQSKPTYHPKELDIYIKNNSEISHLYKIAQEKLGKLLSANDSSTLFSFYDWLRLPVEVIIMLLEYCASINKRDMRYIEKVAIDWADKGIDNHEKAEIYLKKLEMRNNDINVIRNALGISDRMITPAEMTYIDKWINEYKFTVDVVKTACEQTILNTGKASIKYVHSILEDWHKKNIHSVGDAKREMDDFKDKNKEKFTQSKQPKTTKNNKFINFSQRDSDFDKIARLIAQKDSKESGAS